MRLEYIINDMKNNILTIGHQLKEMVCLYRFFMILIYSTLIWSSELKHNEQERKNNATEC